MKVAFAGTPEFAAVALRALLEARLRVGLVLTQPDRPAGRGRRLQPGAVKQAAMAAGLEVRQPRTLRQPEVGEALRRDPPDVLVVVAYGLILPPDILAIPRLGCINVHASLLPRWRGAAPIQRALLAGDDETGVTIMRMDSGLDTGPMLLRLSCPIAPGETAGTLHDRLAVLGARALVTTLARLSEGPVAAVPQDDSLATYAPKIEKAEAELDWREPALQLERKVRAFNPWPVAATTIPPHGRLRIWRSQLAPGGHGAGPGVILRADANGIDVATGDGALRLLEVQRAGGRPLAAASFLNAHPVQAGSRAGG
jgi:methionyl-tRNA formyltransferase